MTQDWDLQQGTAGIYKITNTDNNKAYYGSSKNITKRLAEHLYRLKKNIHDNQYLQASFNKYGEQAFRFETIMYCEEKDLLFYEQRFIDKYWDDCLNCFNIAKDALSPRKGIKYSHTEETKKKLSIIKKGKPIHKLRIKQELEQSIIDNWSVLNISFRDLAKILGCDKDTIGMVLRRNNIIERVS